jgi:hypothetical protein
VTRGRDALAAILLLAACSRRSPATPPAPPVAQAPAAVPAPAVAPQGDRLRIASRGAVSVLAIAGPRLSFCDAAGLHELSLPSGRVLSQRDACPSTAVPRALGPEVTVRTPDLGPDDIVEVEGVATSFPIEGHARDWVSDAGNVVVVATATRVLEILPASEKRVTLSETGAERVAAGSGWAAWWDGAAIFARKL